MGEWTHGFCFFCGAYPGLEILRWMNGLAKTGPKFQVCGKVELATPCEQ